MVATTYDLIEKLEQLDYFNDLLKNGIVPTNWLDYKCIYEFYIREVEKLDDSVKSKRQAKSNTAEEFNISEAHVYRIVKMMGS